jgi:hypothetical protein
MMAYLGDKGQYPAVRASVLAYLCSTTIARHCFSVGLVNKPAQFRKIQLLFARILSQGRQSIHTNHTALINISSNVISINQIICAYPTSYTIHTTHTTHTTSLSLPKTMDTTHRKIELQSPLDLLYLRSNASSLLRSKLDLHFPPSAAPASASDDILKSRVEELVTAYLERVFEDVKGNLNINGLEGREMDEEMGKAEGGGGEGEFCAYFT